MIRVSWEPDSEYESRLADMEEQLIAMKNSSGENSQP